MIFKILILFLFIFNLIKADYHCPSYQYNPIFNCTNPNTKITNKTEKTATSLLPNDIEYFLSFGDSITAGFVMKDFPSEYRGDVYSSGANNNTKSIYNYFKTYNPNIKGGCINNSRPMAKGCKNKDGLSGAISGATSIDIIDQINNIIQRIKKNNSNASYILSKAWKYIMIFIGANDACECNNPDHTPEQYDLNIRKSLDYLIENLPNSYVSIIGLFNISNVYDINQSSKKCIKETHILKECSCLNDDINDRNKMDLHSVLFNEKLAQISIDYQQKCLNNFQVQYQPALTNINFGQWKDEHYLSDLDCFHPSLCTNQLMSLVLWNNLFEKNLNKSSTYDNHGHLNYICPIQGQFLTNKIFIL